MMVWKMYLLSNMAILGIDVRFQGCSQGVILLSTQDAIPWLSREAPRNKGLIAGQTLRETNVF